MPPKKKLDVPALIREIYPVTKAISYGNNCYEFIRTAKQKSPAIKPKRGYIVSMSKKSLIRLMFTMQCTDVEFGSMLTLTYPRAYPSDGNIVKRDVNLMCQRFRRKEWSYVWFLEFQARGAPHLHFLLSPDVITPKMRADVGIFWTERIAMSDWFTSQTEDEKYLAEVLKMLKFNCHENTFELLRLEDGAKRYAAKYAAKEKQKAVPEGYVSVGRFWGASRDVKPDGVEFDVTEGEVEEWLVKNRHPAEAYELVPRYIWGNWTSSTERKKRAGSFDKA